MTSSKSWREQLLSHYKTIKCSTPLELRRMTWSTPDTELSAKYERMAKRRELIYEVYKQVCLEIDDEGDCDEPEK